jgi:hypothetical protein
MNPPPKHPLPVRPHLRPQPWRDLLAAMPEEVRTALPPQFTVYDASTLPHTRAAGASSASARSSSSKTSALPVLGQA